MPRSLIRKVDDNHAEIVATFRRLGYSVRSTATLGKGFPDIIAGKWGHNYLCEIKDGSKPPSARKLTEDEETFWQEWRGSIHLIESVQDVIEFDRKRSRGR
jgi:hypothetical protein